VAGQAGLGSVFLASAAVVSCSAIIIVQLMRRRAPSLQE
jgi:hypothetical protein